MACNNCEGDKDFDRANYKSICRVCELLDQDMSIKRTRYCRPCGVWMCESCRESPLRRAAAIAKEIVGAITGKKKKKFSTDDFGIDDKPIIKTDDTPEATA